MGMKWEAPDRGVTEVERKEEVTKGAQREGEREIDSV